MYVPVADTPGLGASLAGPYRPPITKGGQYIGEGDAGKLLTILSGPSPYRDYIRQVLAAGTGPALPTRFLRIVSTPSQVPDQRLRNRFVTAGGKIVGGTIDRRTGTIYMIPAPGRRGDTRLEFALHEAVHLFAHPFMRLVDVATFESRYGRACTTETDVGTFQRKFCFGLGEGATQFITEQIMKAQGISPSGEKPYREFLPPLMKIIEIFGSDRCARAYFGGAVKELADALQFRWGNEWRVVAGLTSAGKTKSALEWIDRLELAYLKRRSPPGDFPIPSPYVNYT